MTESTASTKAPQFSLLDQDSKEHKLTDYLGKKVLIYFYPKDDTPGCTKEACAIRDIYADFEKNNIKVFGISPDSPASHKKFIEKYHLSFDLLSDPHQEVAKLYEADGMFLKRISYLIDEEGNIIKEYPKVDPANHAAEIIADVVSM